MFFSKFILTWLNLYLIKCSKCRLVNRWLYFNRISKKRGLRRKSKVCTLDNQIRRSWLRISHSKVFSSEYLLFPQLNEIHNGSLCPFVYSNMNVISIFFQIPILWKFRDLRKADSCSREKQVNCSNSAGL